MNEADQKSKPDSLTRREFLKVSGVALAGAVLPSLEVWQTTANLTNKILKSLADFRERKQSVEYPYPPEQAFLYNPEYDSGWIYLASPAQNWWLATVRSESSQADDPTAHLMAGQINPKSGEHEFVILEGTLAENAEELDVSFQFADGNVLFSLSRQSEPDNQFNQLQANIKIPFSSDSTLETQLTLDQAINHLYVNQGKVRLGQNGPESLYISHCSVDQDGNPIETDFQRFRLPEAEPFQFSRFSIKPAETTPRAGNHEWFGIALGEKVANLPVGTRIIVSTQLDSQGRVIRDSNLTSVDLVIPGQKQGSTSTDIHFDTFPDLIWQDPQTRVNRHQALRLRSKAGFDLVVYSPQPAQECHLPGYSVSWLEASALVFRTEDFDPKNPDLGKACGFAMHEATHDARQQIVDEANFLPLMGKNF